jgi:hypothetical protein
MSTCWRSCGATCSADRDVTAAVLIVGGGVAAVLVGGATAPKPAIAYGFRLACRMTSTGP